MKKIPFFDLIQKTYEQLWSQADTAKIIDFGSQKILDPFYWEVLQTADFKSLLVEPSSKTVVDLGAGRGSRLARVLAKKGCAVVAVDSFSSFPTLKMAYLGKRIVANVLDTKLPSDSADVVISAYVALKNPFFALQEHQEKYVTEILRLMKPGALFWGEESDLPRSLFMNRPEIEHYAYLTNYYVHFFRKRP